MEFHMTNMMNAALPMCAQTEKIEHILYSVSLGDALTTAAVQPFFDSLRCCPNIIPQQRLKTIIPCPPKCIQPELILPCRACFS